jgi:branched-chain amino acid transport system substrate-binding protein
MAAMLLPALGGARIANAAQKTVKIGLVVGLSGPGAEIGESIARGADLYISTHQQDLPSGVGIELIKRDDGSNPDRTKRLAQERATARRGDA